MMKSKLLCLLVLVCIMFPIFASCKDNTSVKNDGETDQSTSPVTSDTEVVTEEPFVPDFYLVENGTSAYVIVHAEDASPTEITAATELQSYIKQISGAELPIVSDAEVPAENEIIVGKTNRETDAQFDRDTLGEDGFVINVEEDRIWLVGGMERGTLYAAYTFLEEHLGCRFYTADFEYIPQNEDIGLLLCEDTQIPTIRYRNTSWCATYDSIFSAKRKLNVHSVPDEYGGCETWATSASHTLPELAGVGNGLSNDPCLSDENMYQAVLNTLKDKLADGDHKFVSVSQADVAGFCYCEDCAASIAEYGYSGHYLKFVNRIAEELAVLYPDVIVHTFAYHFTVMPPKGGIVPADNVMVQLCTIECCHNHPLAEYEYSDKSPYIPAGTTFQELIVEWSSICDRLAIWDYTTSFSMYNMMNPNLYVLYDNIHLFGENNVIYTYMQGNRHSTAGEFSELRGYLISKLLWDPFMSREEYFSYMDEFLRDYYGPGWQEIRSWIDLLHKEGNEKCYGTWEISDKLFPLNHTDILDAVQKLTLPAYSADELRSFNSIDWGALYDSLGCQYLYPNKIVIEGYRAMHTAMDLAKTEEQRSRIDKLTIQLDVACSCVSVSGQNHPKAIILPMLFAKAMEPYIADGTFSEGEVTSLKFAFMDISDRYMRGQKQYCIDYNRALAQKMLDHGVTAIYEGGYIDRVPFESLNFEKKPGAVSVSGSWLEIE